MTTENKAGMNGKDWRRLCQMISSEPDASRLSELVDALLNELDRRKGNGQEKSKNEELKKGESNSAVDV